MGRTYLFECPKCSYRAHVSGGADAGAEFTAQTILCYQCKDLQDVVTSRRVPAQLWSDWKAEKKTGPGAQPTQPAPPLDSVLNHLPLPGRARKRWQRFKLACGKSLLHRVREWNQPDKCPRCGVFLERGAIPFRRWE